MQCNVYDSCSDIGRRVEYSGIDVYLPDQYRTPEAIAAAVQDVLAQPKYKERVSKLNAESQTNNLVEIVERENLA